MKRQRFIVWTEDVEVLRLETERQYPSDKIAYFTDADLADYEATLKAFDAWQERLGNEAFG